MISGSTIRLRMKHNSLLEDLGNMVHIDGICVSVRDIYVLAFRVDYRCSDRIPQRPVGRSCDHPTRCDFTAVVDAPYAEILVFGVLAVTSVIVDACGTTAALTSASTALASGLSPRADSRKDQSLFRINKETAN